MVSRVAVLRQLRSPSDAILFLRIFLFAAAVPTLLRLRLPRLATLLEPKHIPSPPEPVMVEKIVHYVDTAMQAGRPLIRPGCLIRGNTLYYFLRQAGVEVSLSFGIGNDGDEFAGHCWLMKDGKPFLEARDPRPFYTETYSFPPKTTQPNLLQPTNQ